MVSTHLKNIRQIGSFPQVGVEIKKNWNHHLVTIINRWFYAGRFIGRSAKLVFFVGGGPLVWFIDFLKLYHLTTGWDFMHEKNREGFFQKLPYDNCIKFDAQKKQWNFISPSQTSGRKQWFLTCSIDTSKNHLLLLVHNMSLHVHSRSSKKKSLAIVFCHSCSNWFA